MKKDLLYYVLFFFMAAFPFMIYPDWSNHTYYAVPKSMYLMYFTLLLWLIFLFHWLRQREEQNFHRLRTAEWMLLIFFFCTAMSTFLSTNTLISMHGEWLRREGIASLFCYGSLFFFTFRWMTLRRQEALYPVLMTAAALVSLYGILQHFHMDFLPRNPAKVNYTRSYAFFDNPNFFGSYLSLMLPFAAMLFLRSHRAVTQILYLMITTILFIALIYSLTRSAWLGGFVGVLILIFGALWKQTQLWKKCSGLVMMFVLVFLLINISENQQYLNRAQTLVKDADTVISGEDIGKVGSSRGYIWKTALPLIPQYFWFGSGPDTFAVVFPDIPEEKEIYFNNPNIKVDKAHNEYLQLAITLGAPALLFYLLFILFIFYSSVKSYSTKNPDHQLLILGLGAAISSYLIQAFFNISVVTVAPFLWIFLGLLYHLARGYSRDV